MAAYKTIQGYRVGRMVREKQRRARRRKYMMQRVLVTLFYISAIIVLIVGIKVSVSDSEVERGINVVSEQPISVSEISKESSTEDLLSSGILTDEITLDYDLQLVAREAAENFNVPYKLLLAVMFKESSYNPDAHNSICYGLMQIHQMNFDYLEEELSEYGVTDIKNNPKDNIYAGAYMLGNLISKYEDYHKALMAYNCGENGAKKLWDKGYASSEYSRDICEMMMILNVVE